MQKILVITQTIDPVLFANMETPKFKIKTPTMTIVEQSEAGDVIRKFQQKEQTMLLDIEYQITPAEAVSELTQIVMSRILEAIT
ncbi:MAG: hypothetical protein EZS28_028216 [Streblomastix strix]|uniref:Uncharacterized protein n=1 Tax=Streblomastix strix TaxID=222440 RepID=A0A5J4V2H8_9EUKA|nr:MAG: hypothetical protein EZS28_028216 [Streblomastix strix]